MNTDCRKCGSKCCREPFELILLPHEEENKLFKAASHDLATPYRTLKVIRKKHDKCIFLTKKGKCAIYSRRPIECMLYPMVMVFSEGKLDVRCDNICQAVVVAAIGFEDLQKQTKDLPEDWIKAYMWLDTRPDGHKWIDASVKRICAEYGEVLKKLGDM